MTAESRGRILGEKPLERSSNDSSGSVPSVQVVRFQNNLSDTFTKPASLVESLEAANPFKDDPAKQERFEQFLKDKYLGGLRSTFSGGSNSNMSEADRACERLDFEAAAEAIEKGKQITATGALTSEQRVDILEFGKGHFVSGGIEPQHVPRAWSKMDSLIFMPDFVRTLSTEQPVAVQDSSASQVETDEVDAISSGKEADDDTKISSVERPVDLYKAIFSANSDDEEKQDDKQVDDSQKKNEAINTTLNRLIAGDFLESLGKELGMEVPEDAQHPINNVMTLESQKNSTPLEDAKVSSRNNVSAISLKTSIGSAEAKDVSGSKSGYHQTTKELTSPDRHHGEELSKVVSTDRYQRHDFSPAYQSADVASGSMETEGGYLEQKAADVGKNKVSPMEKMPKSHSRRHMSSSSSEMESSDDYGSRDRSSRRRRRKHSKHHSHRSKESSPRSSHCGSGKCYAEGRWDKRKLRDRRKDSKSKSNSHRKHGKGKHCT